MKAGSNYTLKRIPYMVIGRACPLISTAQQAYHIIKLH